MADIFVTKLAKFTFPTRDAMGNSFYLTSKWFRNLKIRITGPHLQPQVDRFFKSIIDK